MTDLQDKIQDTFVPDETSILESNIERAGPMFNIYEEGTINIEGKYRKIPPKHQILIYFVAQRFAYEGNLSDEETLNSDFFYERIDKSERTIRSYLQELREDGYIKKEKKGVHRVITENIPDALDLVEEEVEDE
jgi:DNA-binding transcriptional ArsR family regulator